MGTAIKHPVPDRIKPSVVIFDIRALWRPYTLWFKKNVTPFTEQWPHWTLTNLDNIYQKYTLDNW